MRRWTSLRKGGVVSGIGAALLLLAAAPGARAGAPPVPAELAASCWMGADIARVAIKVKPRVPGVETVRLRGLLFDKLCFGPLPALGHHPELAAGEFHVNLHDAAHAFELRGTYLQESDGDVLFTPDTAALAALFEQLLDEYAGGLPAVQFGLRELGLGGKAVLGSRGERATFRAQALLVGSFEEAGRSYEITVRLRHRTRMQRGA
jgi:hypothetical protein